MRWLVFAIVLAACSSDPIPPRQFDWIVFELGDDGVLVRDVPTGHFEASGAGPHCWMLSAGESSAYTEWNWVAPDGHEHPTPAMASRVRVINGDWQGTAARLGINIMECK